MKTKSTAPTRNTLENGDFQTPETVEQLAEKLDNVIIEEQRKDDEIWNVADQIGRELSENEVKDLERDDNLWNVTDQLNRRIDEVLMKHNALEQRLNEVFNRLM
jgi:hypothetical protein